MVRSALLAVMIGGTLGIGLGAAIGCTFCDDGVCSSTLWVNVREPGRVALQDGEYVVEAEVDGEPDSATCTVAEGGHSMHCDGMEYVLYTPLFDSQDNPHTLLQLYYSGNPPRHVSLRITHDGAVVVDEAFDVDYEQAEPECDEDCMHATHDFELTR